MKKWGRRRLVASVVSTVYHGIPEQKRKVQAVPHPEHGLPLLTGERGKNYLRKEKGTRASLQQRFGKVSANENSCRKRESERQKKSHE